MSKIFKIAPWVILIALAITLYFKWNQPIKLVAQNSLKSIAEVAKNYKDAQGANHIAINKNANSIQPKEILDPAKVPGFVDTASKALKIAKQEIDQITKLKFEVEQKLLMANLIIDSLGVERYTYVGKHLQITWKNDKKKDFPNGYFDYKYTAGMQSVDYTKKTKFLGITLAQKSFTDYSFDDPYAQILDGIQRFTVDRSEKKPWLKINANYEYNLQENSHGYGPAVKYENSLIGVQISQLYWPINQSWQTTVNAHLTLKNVF